MSPFIIGGICAFLIIAGVVVWVSIEHRKIKRNVVLFSGLLASIIVLLYGEFGPGGGNMWWRLTADGEHKFNARGVYTLLFSPLDPNAIWLWSPEWWIQNVFVLTPIILILMTYISRK